MSEIPYDAEWNEEDDDLRPFLPAQITPKPQAPNLQAAGGASLQKILVDANTLAFILDMSPEWVSKNRAQIVGGLKIGGRWRFNVDVIRDRLARGLSPVQETPRPHRPQKPRVRKF